MHQAVLLDATADIVEEPITEQAEFQEDNDDLEVAMNLESLAVHLVEEKTVRPAGFVVSITRGGRCRRLHFAGGCSRIPGEHHGKLDDFGQVVPPESAYSHRCKDCFPAGITTRTAEE